MDEQAMAMDLVGQLESVRREAGISRSGLARRARIDRGAVYDVLDTGRGQMHTVMAIARALGLRLYAVTPPSSAQLRPCGTLSAARRHYARGEKLDPLCRAVQREYDRDRKRSGRAARRGAVMLPRLVEAGREAS